MKRCLPLIILALFFLPSHAAPKLGPSVLYSTLLNGMTLQDDGRLRFSRLTGYFIPKPQTSTGSQYLYNPDDGAEMNVVIRKQGGQPVCTFGVYAMPHNNIAWRMDTFRDLETKDLEYQFQEPGNYVLDFQIEGETFQTVPFSVHQSQSDDPYGGGSQWYLGGDWERYGYIHIPNASPTSTVTFKTWMRADQPKTVKGHATITGPNGKVVGESPEAQYLLKSAWARHPFQFRTKSGTSLTGAELTKTPGDYTLTVTLDGATQVFGFQVQGQKIVRAGRQAFTAEPTARIEGGKDAWWLEAE